MKNKVFVTFLLALFVVNFVSAEVTEINVRTLPGHELQLTILDAKSDSFLVLERMKGTSDKDGYILDLNGETLFKYGGGEFSFKLNAFVKDMEGNTVFSKKLDEEFIAGTPIDVEFFPDGKTAEEIFPEPEPVIVEEAIEEEPVAVEKAAEPGLSGAVVFGGEFFSKNVPYLVGGILVIVLFVGVFVLGRKDIFHHLPKISLPHIGGGSSSKDSVEDAEKKIKEAEEELGRIRAKDKD